MINKEQVYGLASKNNLNSAEINEMAIPSYTHWNPLIRWVFYKRLDKLKRFTSFAGKNVLDFGCGIGLLFKQYINSKKVYACDLHPEIAKERAKRLGLKVKFIKDLSELPSNEIDVAVFADVLEHINDIEVFINELKTKMRKDGKLIISLPTESKFYKFCRFIAGYNKKAIYHVGEPWEIEKILNKTFRLAVRERFPKIFSLFTLYRYEMN